MNDVPNERRFFLPLLSSCLYILSFPKFNLAALAWVALVPLALYAQRSTLKQAFYAGWLSGTLAYIGLLYWIVVTFHAAHLSLALAVPCLILLSGYLGLYWGAWAATLSYCAFCPAQKNQPSASFERFERSTTMMFLAAAGWVALEYLRTYLFSGFPWVLLGDSQVRILPVIQIASLTGVYGISFLIVLVNLAIAQWKPKSLVMAGGLALLSVGFGISHMKQLDSESRGQEIHVALLQGSIDQYKKWDADYVSEIQQTYEGLVSHATAAKPDMIIWPETSVPGYLLQDPPLRTWLLNLIKKSGTSHLVGAPSMKEEQAYNAAFSITSEGKLLGYYAKKHLVPFGEIVPWKAVLGKFVSVLNELGGFAAGTESAVVSLAGYPVGVNICYEAIFPNLVRHSVRQGAVVIANLTNDGWYMKTSAPYQHWAPNIMRAVENGRWLIRADNTGISGIIDPSGRVTAASAIFEPTVIQGTVFSRTPLTPYTRLGDVFAWLCVMFCAVILIRDILRG